MGFCRPHQPLPQDRRSPLRESMFLPEAMRSLPMKHRQMRLPLYKVNQQSQISSLRRAEESLPSPQKKPSVLSPILAITKSVSPVPVTENGTLTYTFQIQNSGNTAADAAAGIVVTDTFTPRLSNLTATLNGTALVLNTDYTYDETTGEFATVAGRITVPAATFITNPATGTISTDPGVTTLTISGTI